MFNSKRESVHKSNLYTIFDKTAERPGPLFEATTDGVAQRMAAHTLQHVPVRFRNEYMLLCVGRVIYDKKHDCIQSELINDFRVISFEEAYWQEISEVNNEKEV